MTDYDQNRIDQLEEIEDALHRLREACPRKTVEFGLASSAHTAVYIARVALETERGDAGALVSQINGVSMMADRLQDVPGLEVFGAGVSNALDHAYALVYNDTTALHHRAKGDIDTVALLDALTAAQPPRIKPVISVGAAVKIISIKPATPDERGVDSGLS